MRAFLLVLTLALAAACAPAGEPTDLPAADPVATDPTADPGLVIVESAHGVDTTYARLKRAVESKGPLAIVFEFDHASNAAGAGSSLPPARVLAFGNPALGTPLMQAEPTVGLDLPQRVLVWQSADGTTRLAYNDPFHLARRHGIAGLDSTLQTIAGALAGIAEAATAP